MAADLPEQTVVHLIDRINASNRELTAEITSTHRSLTAEISQTNQNVALLMADIKEIVEDFRGSIAHSDEVRATISSHDARLTSLETRILNEEEHADFRVMRSEWKNRRAVMTQVQAHTEGTVWDRRFTLINILMVTVYTAVTVALFLHTY